MDTGSGEGSDCALVVVAAGDARLPAFGPNAARRFRAVIVVPDLERAVCLGVPMELVRRTGLASAEVLRELACCAARLFATPVGAAMALPEDAEEKALLVVSSGLRTRCLAVATPECLDDLAGMVADEPGPVATVSAFVPAEAWVG